MKLVWGIDKETRDLSHYFLLNGSVSYDLSDKTALFLEGFNLLGDNHKEHPDAHSYRSTLSLGFRHAW